MFSKIYSIEKQKNKHTTKKKQVGHIEMCWCIMPKRISEE